VHVRRPRLDYESHATGLDRNELGGMLVAAGLAGPLEHALLSLLALNGLRVSEAIGADIEHSASNAATAPSPFAAKAARSCSCRSRRAPLAPSISPSGNDRLGRSSRPLNVNDSTARRRKDRAPHRPQSRDHQTSRPPHPAPRLHHAALDAGVRYATCKKPPATPTPEPPCANDRARVSLDRHATYIVSAFIAGAAR